MSQPLLTISIVSHADGEKIKTLLTSLFHHEQDKTYQYLITDNLGSENYSDSAFQKAEIIRNKAPKGFAENHNAAFQKARGQYFCVFNPDILFVEPVFEKLLQHLQQDRADILAPLIVDSKGVVQDSFRRLPSPKEIIARRLFKAPPVQRPAALFSPDWLAGMFLLMRKETFKSLRGFDERYFFYFEDVDFSTRARLAGYRLLLDPFVKVQHDAHRGSRQSLRYLLWHLQSAWKFFSSDTYKKAK